MFIFSELYSFPNSTTRTVHGVAGSGFTSDTAFTNSTFDLSSVFALAGSSFTSLADNSSVIYHEDGDGNWAGTTATNSTTNTTDSGTLSIPTSTTGGTTTGTVITNLSRGTTISTTGTTKYSFYNTKAKTSSTKSFSIKSTRTATQAFPSIGIGMTETTYSTVLPPAPFGVRLRVFADTAAGEILLVPRTMAGVVWEGNAFYTATSYLFTPPSPLGSSEYTASLAPSVSSATVITNPGNGLTWHSRLTLTKPTTVLVSGATVNSFTDSGVSIVQGFFDYSGSTTSKIITVPATILTTAGGGSYDETTLTVGTDENVDSTAGTITVASTINDFISQLSVPGDTAAHFLPVVTSVESTVTVSSIAYRSAQTTESSTFSTSDTVTKTGSPSTRSVLISSFTSLSAEATYMTWNGSYMSFELATNFLNSPQRLVPVPMGGGQLFSKAGVNNPLFRQAEGSAEILMMGGALVGTSLKDKALLDPRLSRMVAFGLEGGTIVLGAPVLRTANPEADHFLFAGVIVYKDKRVSSNFINRNVTSQRTVATGDTVAYEPVPMSTVRSALIESNPGELPPGELFRSQSSVQNL